MAYLRVSNPSNRLGDVFLRHGKTGGWAWLGLAGPGWYDLRLELSQAAGGITEDERLLVSDGSCCAQ